MIPSRIERLARGHDSHREAPIQTNDDQAIVSFYFACFFAWRVWAQGHRAVNIVDIDHASGSRGYFHSPDLNNTIIQGTGSSQG